MLTYVLIFFLIDGALKYILELAYEPEVDIDVSEFSGFLPDINAYEYKDIIGNETISVLSDHEDEEYLLIIDNWPSDDDTNTEGMWKKGGVMPILGRK